MTDADVARTLVQAPPIRDTGDRKVQNMSVQFLEMSKRICGLFLFISLSHVGTESSLLTRRSLKFLRVVLDASLDRRTVGQRAMMHQLPTTGSYAFSVDTKVSV